MSFWLTRSLGPDHSGQKKPKPALADVQLDEPTERHRSNHHHRQQVHVPKLSDAFHIDLARESLRRSTASDCYFRGLLGMGLGNATQAGFRQ